MTYDVTPYAFTQITVSVTRRRTAAWLGPWLTSAVCESSAEPSEPTAVGSSRASSLHRRGALARLRAPAGGLRRPCECGPRVPGVAESCL